MTKQIPIYIVFLAGIIMVAQYFVPHQASEFVFTYANDFVIVIGILLPYELAVIPAYALVNRLDMVGSYVSMVILYLGLMMPMTSIRCLYISRIRSLASPGRETGHSNSGLAALSLATSAERSLTPSGYSMCSTISKGSLLSFTYLMKAAA